MKPVWKRIAWETVMVVVCMLGAYEIIGLDPRFPQWHTISFEAYLHPSILWTVAVGALALVGIFEVWWQHHARSPHVKLYVGKKHLKEYEDYMKKYGKKGPHI